jgi:glyoxylase-like metal-dependent hydrolase (beta-lactamase superfamily II)
MTKVLYHSIYPTPIKLDGGAMFGIIPKPLWEKKIIPDQKNRIKMSCRSFYIAVDDRHILIDLGVGDYHGAKFDHMYELAHQSVENALQGLANIGTNDITDIILTHLHFDHAGGLGTKSGDNPMFPNATLHLHRSHYEYSKNPTPRDSGSFQQKFIQNQVSYYEKKGQIHWLESNDKKILETTSGHQLKFLESFGHTPYQILPYDNKMIYLGDLVPTSHHLPIAWSIGYDMQPGVTALEKKKIYDFILKNKLAIIFDHDLDTWGGFLAKKINDKGKEVFFLEKTFPVKNHHYEKHTEI